MRNSLKFVIVFLTMVLLSGCGKDDKSVTSVIPPSSYTYGSLDSAYSNAIPRNLTVSAVGHDSTAANIISWDAPTMTTNLTGYRVYLTSTSLSTGLGVGYNGPDDTDRYDSATDGHSYSYTVTSLFTILDTVYNFYYEIESCPTRPAVLDR